MQLNMLPATLLALVPLVAASPGGYSYGSDTTSSGSSSSGSSSSGSGGTQSAAQTQSGVTRIDVGKGGQLMSPNDVTVPMGGIIEFHFYQGAHSVAQSAFDSPCMPLTTTASNGTEGFFSGPVSVSSGESNNVFRVTSTGSPMWYYCATGKHCQNGMVGVINKPANGQKTIQQYTAAAAKAAQNVPAASVKGGTLVDANSSTGTGTGTGGTGTGTGGTGTGTGTGSASNPTRTSAGDRVTFSLVGLAAAAFAAALAL